MESEARVVGFEEALAEEDGQTQENPQSGAPGGSNVFVERGRPVPPTQTQEEKEQQASIEEAKEDLDILAPKTAPREWTFGPEGQQRTYIQYELSVTGSAQWFGLLGEVLEELMSGDNPLSLNSLMAPPKPRQPGQFQVQDFQDADMFVGALAKLLTHAPKFLEKSVCIWLGVPDYEWDLVSMLMKLPPSQGGMTFDMFEEILATFIDQNYAEIDRFFRGRFQHLRDRWQARAKEASQSRSSRR